MKNICVIGTGYVGLVTGACFADLGHKVACVDIDSAKIASLRKGVMPIYEPGLEPLVHRHLESGRLCFTTSLEKAVKGADFLFMCVGTPATEKHQADLSYLHKAYLDVGNLVSGGHTILVNKSTIPPGTTEMMASALARMLNGHGAPPIVANPEFLREGHAVSDFMKPNRVVIGASDHAAGEAVADLYRCLGAPIMFTTPRTAEMIKFASNAFLATKVTFINEMAGLCEKLDIDIATVARGIGLDPRIGMDYLRAGIGYGGSCLPKDTAILSHLAASHGYESKLVDTVIEVNADQPRRFVHRVREALGVMEGAEVAVLGLAFKSDTDDLRFSPAVEVVRGLLALGAHVRSYDPKARCKPGMFEGSVTAFHDPYEAARGADAVVIATEWAEFKALDLPRLKSVMRGIVLADGKNLLDPRQAQAAGFLFVSVGKGVAMPDFLKRDALVTARLD